MDNSTKKFLTFGAPLIGDEEINEVVETLRSGWIGSGPRVAQFEKDFKEYRGSDYAVAVNSCTAALHLSMIAAGVTAGDEVIAPALTFCATVNSIIHSGATPVIADVDAKSMNIDLADVERRITDRTRAIIPVHLCGRPCEMDGLMKLAKKHNLKIIEDCAHAVETEYHGQAAGTFGDFGCFSFYVTKNIVTGEGGMILTKNGEDANRVKVLALHGMSADAWRRFSDSGYKHYFVTECGYKYNMMDMQAAIGIHQLRKVEQFYTRREEIWNQYDSELKSMPLSLPAPAEENTKHGRHLYTVLVDGAVAGLTRDEFLTKMHENKIGVGVHYLCLAEHPYYQETFGWKPEDYPAATKIGRQTVSLPLSPKLTREDTDRVVETIGKLF